MVSTILRRIHRQLYWFGYFLFFILLLLLSTAGIDHMVTGIIRPDIQRNVFIAYVMWQALMNLSIAIGVTLFAYVACLERKVCLLIFLTVSWCWWGGALDWLYFMIHGSIPSLYYVWWWVLPFWTTLHHAIYTLICFSLLGFGWYRNRRS